MSSLEMSKLSFVKAQLYGLGFASATFYLRSFKLLVLFTSTCFVCFFYFPDHKNTQQQHVVTGQEIGRSSKTIYVIACTAI